MPHSKGRTNSYNLTENSSIQLLLSRSLLWQLVAFSYIQFQVFTQYFIDCLLQHMFVRVTACACMFVRVFACHLICVNRGKRQHLSSCLTSPA